MKISRRDALQTLAIGSATIWIGCSTEESSPDAAVPSDSPSNVDAGGRDSGGSDGFVTDTSAQGDTGPGPAIRISGTEWTPNFDSDGRVLPTDYPQLPAQWVQVATNRIDDLVPATARYGTTVSGADGLRSVILAWSGAARDWVNGRIYMAGGGHADSWGTENGVFGFDVQTMRYFVAVPRAPYASAQYWDRATQTYIEGTSRGGNLGPQRDGSPPASHTYHALNWLPGTRLAGNTNGYFINHCPGPVTAIADLDTGRWLPGTWFQAAAVGGPIDKDFSYATAWAEWPMLWSPGIGTPQQFAGMSYRLDQTEATSWSATSLTRRVENLSGINVIYNNRFQAKLEQRREVVNFGASRESVSIVRMRLGEAADARATDLSTFSDAITLAGPDAADFSVTALNEASNGILWEAGAAYDEWTDSIWVIPNMSDQPLYRLTGLNSNTWTVSKFPTLRTLSTSAQVGTRSNGTYSRVICYRIGGTRFLSRVTGTMAYAEVLRLPSE
jgi:hypothetical protein